MEPFVAVGARLPCDRSSVIHGTGCHVKWPRGAVVFLTTQSASSFACIPAGISRAFGLFPAISTSWSSQYACAWYSTHISWIRPICYASCPRPSFSSWWASGCGSVRCPVRRVGVYGWFCPFWHWAFASLSLSSATIWIVTILFLVPVTFIPIYWGLWPSSVLGSSVFFTSSSKGSWRHVWFKLASPSCQWIGSSSKLLRHLGVLSETVCIISIFSHKLFIPFGKCGVSILCLFSQRLIKSFIFSTLCLHRWPSDSVHT